MTSAGSVGASRPARSAATPRDQVVLVEDPSPRAPPRRSRARARAALADRREVRQRLRIDDRDASPRCARGGTRAPRGRTGTTAAPRPRPSGRRRCARSRSRGAAAASARPGRRARRRAPRARWTGGWRRAAGPRTCTRRSAPDSSSQYSAKRDRSFAQRPQQACADVEVGRHVPAEPAVDVGVAVGRHRRKNTSAGPANAMPRLREADRCSASRRRGAQRGAPGAAHPPSGDRRARPPRPGPERRATIARHRRCRGRAARPWPTPSPAAARAGARSGSG